MSGASPGERRGGRQRGTKNKATIEREQRALADLQERAQSLPRIKRLAVDALADMVPEADELAKVVKSIVGHKQQLAFAEGAEKAAWDDLREWISLYKDVFGVCSQVKHRAADFQAPKYKAIAVMVNPLPQPESRPIVEHEPRDAAERERRAANAYLTLVKG